MTSASARESPDLHQHVGSSLGDAAGSPVAHEVAEGEEAVVHVDTEPFLSREVLIRVVVEVRPSGGERCQPAPGSSSSMPRPRSVQSGGGKREVTFAWSADAVAGVRDAHRRIRRTVDGLSLSALVGAALEVALGDPKAWLGGVPDDLRRSRPGQPRRQVSVQLPEALVRRFNGLWDRLDGISADVWGEGFRLTKAHLALAGIEYALASAPDAVMAALVQDPQ